MRIYFKICDKANDIGTQYSVPNTLYKSKRHNQPPPSLSMGVLDKLK